MTLVQSKIATEPNTAVVARLQGIDNWTIDHAEWVSPVTTTADSLGAWSMELPPQNHFKSASTCWRIEHRYGTRLIVVPDSATPVYVDDIEVHSVIVPGDPNAQPIYVLRSEIGRPSGVAGLGADGKVPAAQLPASSGGDVPDATTTSKGIMQLSGDLAGTAGSPTVPGLAAIAGKYTKPVDGIPSGDMTAQVQADLNAAHNSAAMSYVDAAVTALTTSINTKADAAATTSALAGKASKMRVSAAYVDTGTPSGDVPPNTSGSWTKYAGVGELVIPAAVGDFVEVDLACVVVAAASSTWDIGIMVGSSIVWTSSSGTATPSGDGDPGLAPFSPPVRPFMSAAGWLVVGGGHLDGGNIRFVLLSNSDGGGKIFHATTNPFRWVARNHGPVV